MNTRKAFLKKVSDQKLFKPANTLEGELLRSERKNVLAVPHFVATQRCSTAPGGMGARSRSKLTSPNESANRKYEQCINRIGEVDALANRKKDIQAEMEHLNRILEHKRMCLAAGAYGGYGKLLETLHPAIQQLTTKDER